MLNEAIWMCILFPKKSHFSKSLFSCALEMHYEFYLRQINFCAIDASDQLQEHGFTSLLHGTLHKNLFTAFSYSYLFISKSTSKHSLGMIATAF